MRVRCNLPAIRGARKLRALAAQALINPGTLSKIEQGITFPKDSEVPRLEAAYGALVTDWYPSGVLLAIEFDDDEADALADRMHFPPQVVLSRQIPSQPLDLESAQIMLGRLTRDVAAGETFRVDELERP